MIKRRYLILLGLAVTGAVFGLSWRPAPVSSPYRWYAAANEPNGPVWLFEYLPADGKLTAVIFPSDLMVQAAGSFGRYRIGSLAQLGEQEGMGLALVTNTLINQLGVSIRGGVGMDDLSDSEDQKEQVIGTAVSKLVRQQLGSGPLNWPQTVSLWWNLKRLESSDTKVFAFDQLGLGSSGQDVDGQTINLFDLPAWDRWWDNYHQRLVINQQRFSVAIENNTGVSGAAALAGRVLSRDGFEVIAVIDGRNFLPRTMVVMGTESAIGEEGTEPLKYLFDGADWRTEAIADQRSQILVRIGKSGQGLWLKTD